MSKSTRTSSIWQTLSALVFVGLFFVTLASPASSRFLTPDTYNPWDAGVDINRYAYSGNDPINNSDPNGHNDIQEWDDNFGSNNCGACTLRPPMTPDQLDNAQNALSAFGMIPGVGIPADLTNAVISLKRGNILDAGMNAASVIPGLGDLLQGEKLAGKGLMKLSAKEVRNLGFKEHHILPQSFRDSAFLKDIGFDIDGAYNKIWLPGSAAINSFRTIHNGIHLSSYTGRFAGEINRLKSLVKSGSLTNAEARAQLQQFVSKMRQQLKNGSEQLNAASKNKK